MGMAGITPESEVPFDYMRLPGTHNAASCIQSIGHNMSVQRR